MFLNLVILLSSLYTVSDSCNRKSSIEVKGLKDIKLRQDG